LVKLYHLQGRQHKVNGSLSPEEIEESNEFSSSEVSDDDSGGSDPDTSYLGGSSTSDEELFTDSEDLISSEEELGGDNEADTSANPKGKDAHKSTLISNYDGNFYTCTGSESGQVETEQREPAASSATVPSSERSGIMYTIL